MTEVADLPLADNPPDVVPGSPQRSPIPVITPIYTEQLKERIIDEYLGGLSLKQVCALDGMPSYPTLMRWLKYKDGLREAIIGACEVKALDYEERALEAADDAKGKDDTPAQRLKFEALRWAAEINDPARYAKKVTVGGDPKRPIIFQVVTGVPAPEAHQLPPELNPDGTQVKKAVDITDAVLVEEVLAPEAPPVTGDEP